VLRCFGREYGTFSYSNLKFDQWQQASSQPHRHVGQIADDPDEREGSHLRSWLYTYDIIPKLKGHEAMLDFGCGRGAYARAMKQRGHRMIDVEFYRRKVGSFEIDHNTVQK
jgi:2-polyprenyl-3-methyl-5-hydroxy-6-metoxy-1,4-benzoquinol methylase